MNERSKPLKPSIEYLNNCQYKIAKEAIQWFRNSSKQVFKIAGPAGSGKSYLISAILNELGLREYEYYAMAYTGQAAIVMRQRGFRGARSIHSTLYEYVSVIDNSDNSDDNFVKKFGNKRKRMEFRLRGYIDPRIRLFFIDEASMVPENMVKDILSFGVKVIVCGDNNQLPPINGNGVFLEGNDVHYLTELMRQSADSPIIYLANRAIKGLPIHEGNYGSVYVINQTEIIPEMLDWGDCIVCGTNATREFVNGYIRGRRGFSNSALPQYGERLICRKNNWEEEVDGGISLANGLCGTVVAPPSVFGFDGKTFELDFKPDLSNGVFRNLKANYEYFISDIRRKDELRSDKTRKYFRSEFFDFAYCITTHLAQGGEFANGIYIEEPFNAQTVRQLNYTGITRFKKKMIYIKRINPYFEVPKITYDNILYKGDEIK